MAQVLRIKSPKIRRRRPSPKKKDLVTNKKVSFSTLERGRVEVLIDFVTPLRFDIIYPFRINGHLLDGENTGRRCVAEYNPKNGEGTLTIDD